MVVKFRILYVESDTNEKEASVLLERITECITSVITVFDVVPNAFTGLDYTEHTCYDLIMIKKGFRQLDAQHLLRILRNVGAPMPIVLILDSHDPMTEAEVLSAGFYCSLRKEFSATSMIAVIERAIRDQEDFRSVIQNSLTTDKNSGSMTTNSKIDNDSNQPACAIREFESYEDWARRRIIEKVGPQPTISNHYHSNNVPYTSNSASSNPRRIDTYQPCSSSKSSYQQLDESITNQVQVQVAASKSSVVAQPRLFTSSVLTEVVAACWSSEAAANLNLSFDLSPSLMSYAAPVEEAESDELVAPRKKRGRPRSTSVSTSVQLGKQPHQKDKLPSIDVEPEMVAGITSETGADEFASEREGVEDYRQAGTNVPMHKKKKKKQSSILTSSTTSSLSTDSGSTLPSDLEK